MAVQRDQNNTYYVDFKVKDSSGTWPVEASLNSKRALNTTWLQQSR